MRINNPNITLKDLEKKIISIYERNSGFNFWDKIKGFRGLRQISWSRKSNYDPVIWEIDFEPDITQKEIIDLYYKLDESK